jgi:hypothetical protein
MINTGLKIGDKHGDDIYVGRIMVNGALKGILLPPKAIRQPDSRMQWLPDDTTCSGATSWNNGQQNTQEMADAGSELAKWALEKGLHIPSQDELEIIYRACKPTKDPNTLWNRSGINVSSVPPTHPYTRELPLQTTLEEFQQGGAEAFDINDWYWSSTRHPEYEFIAYAQSFKNGIQDTCFTDTTCYGCAVRWIDL